MPAQNYPYFIWKRIDHEQTSGRRPEQLRQVRITRHYIKHPEGSVLVEFGDTKVLCNASVEAGVPRFLRGKGQGWVTAEYGMFAPLHQQPYGA